MSLPELIDGAGDVLLLCDHASAAVPADIDLGVAPEVMAKHVAVDIGAGPLTRALATRLGAPAVLGTVSRLVIDLHREPDHPHLIPVESDGHAVVGNAGADRAERIRQFYAPYHRAIRESVRRHRPVLLVAVHSFTPRLEVGMDADRRWQVGILSNRDRRAAGLAIACLAVEGLIVGDNEPYSGRQLNLTLNRHAEAQGIASFSLEVRNDLINDTAGVAGWADTIARVIADVRNKVAWQRSSAA
jgi:predicted N-formylglutamate amidohydrolase